MLYQITTRIQTIHKRIKWEWVHSHQVIRTIGEWVNATADKIATKKMEQYSHSEHDLPIHSTDEIRFQKDHTDYDTNILYHIRSSIYDHQQTTYMCEKYNWTMETMEKILWDTRQESVKKRRFYTQIQLQKLLINWTHIN